MPDTAHCCMTRRDWFEFCDSVGRKLEKVIKASTSQQGRKLTFFCDFLCTFWPLQKACQFDKVQQEKQLQESAQEHI